MRQTAGRGLTDPHQDAHEGCRAADLAVVTYNDVPPANLTRKYERLGPMALENRRQYCRRHGYCLIDAVPVARDRPACWAKIPALLAALESHAWVLWADSDALIFNQAFRADRLCDPDFDLVVQSHEEFYRLLGLPVGQGLDRMPINTGAFLVRASSWAKDFLRQAYGMTQYVTRAEPWDGIGEQEAMIELLRRNPEDRRRIRYVSGLQSHPRWYRQGDLLVHFYGNFAPHLIGSAECEAVLRRWEQANLAGGPLPTDLARFHWCCIQNQRPDSPVVRGDLAEYFYTAADIGIASGRGAGARAR